MMNRKMTIAVNEISGLNDSFVKIVTDGTFYYVGALFGDGNINRFAASPRYRTIKGAIAFAFKWYKL